MSICWLRGVWSLEDDFCKSCNSKAISHLFGETWLILHLSKNPSDLVWTGSPKENIGNCQTMLRAWSLTISPGRPGHTPPLGITFRLISNGATIVGDTLKSKREMAFCIWVRSRLGGTGGSRGGAWNRTCRIRTGWCLNLHFWCLHWFPWGWGADLNVVQNNIRLLLNFLPFLKFDYLPNNWSGL